MEKFVIPPEYGLVINAITSTKTLRGAAQLLNMDPAGLVRKVQKIQAEFGLIEKLGNRWVVTEKGMRVGQWTQESISQQKLLLNERPTLRLASFTWLAEEMLIPNFTKLVDESQNKFIWSFKTISSDLEQELIQGRSDFVITGHAPTDPTIAYKKVKTYPWSVIIPGSWGRKIANLEKEELISFLKKMPHVRLSVMPPEQTLTFKPEVYSDMMVDGIIGIRTAVAQGLGWGCVPAMSIKSLVLTKQIIRINLAVHTKDDFSLWWLRSRKDTGDTGRDVVKWMSTFEI